MLDKTNVNQVVKSTVIAFSSYPTAPGNTDIITLRTIMNRRICRQSLGEKAEVPRDTTDVVVVMTLFDIR